MRKQLRRLWPLLCVAAIAAVVGGAKASASAKDAPAESHDEAYQRNITIFNALTRELEESYVDSVRVDDAFKAAIRGMLATVDPYTEYYSYDDKESISRLTTGAYGGIGSFILGRNGNTYIDRPIVGSPAMKAGLKPGDRILRVDTVDVVGLSSDKTSGLLRGQPGTDVVVTVERPYAAPDSILTFTITREKVGEPSVPWYGVVKGNIGYIRLTQFVESSAADVLKAIEEFQANPEVKYLVLDLRGNGGGLVDQAVKILSYFLPKGTEVLRTRGKDVASEKIYKTQQNPVMPDIPMAVLIDGGSASASEITAGALQDLDRAVLIGTQSFGKGLVQGTRPLPYNALLKVTQAKYYIPSGRLIQALDYSHRNPDGSVARVPDSLTNVYHTLAGREVRDGGGLRPDSVVSPGRLSPLVYSLLAGQQIFDYATKYVATHPAPDSLETFSLTDEDFADFADGIDPKSVTFDKLCNNILKDLREAAEAEGYLNPQITAAIDSLDRQLDHDLRSDLYTKRGVIEEYITQEIASRYEPGSGEVRRELVDDPALSKAEEIFTTPGLYQSILGQRPKEQAASAQKK
ncbi:MAG: S41 family peptidase [Muribaculaceae bacterium]|nr:S41 family peptidase [Muribaculaceae bacterium]MDE6448276.1 S41 family peptidase [Muribaculaceae bacterium]